MNIGEKLGALKRCHDLHQGPVPDRITFPFPNLLSLGSVKKVVVDYFDYFDYFYD